MIMINNPLPKPQKSPLEKIQDGADAARQLRQGANTQTLTVETAEAFMDRIAAALDAALMLAASAPASAQPFTVIQGGRS